MTNQPIPIIHAEDGELLGYIAKAGKLWQAQTEFGYVFARTETEQEAEQVVRVQGRLMLGGVWQYLDKDDSQWHPCVLKDVSPTRVTIIRTNEQGYQDKKSYKYVTIENPDETTLVKSS